MTFDATAQAALDSTRRSVVWLCDMEFSTVTQRFCTWTSKLNVDGNDYLAIPGNLVEISQILESEDTKPDRLTVAFSVVNSAMRAACIGPPSVYRNRPLKIYFQVLDGNGKKQGAKELRWQGKMVDVKIPQTAGRLLDNGFGRVEVHCLRSGMAGLRNYEGLRLTNAQQQERFPGDLGLEYMDQLIEKPEPWLTIDFQRQA